MNATSLYVSTSRLVFQSESASDQSWTDLFRLVPYLRQSLSCTVCGRLLIEPFTPVEAQCQHHVCRLCVRGRKNLKPACNCCKDYEKYEENVQLRILLQCYKSLCEYIMTTSIYSIISNQSNPTATMNNGSNIPSVSLVEFIEEGARFQDNFKCNAGLTKSALSLLPCVFNNPTPPAVNNSCLTTQPMNNVIATAPVETKAVQMNQPPPIKTVSNGSAMYSVLYTGIGNKITIKRKTDGEDEFSSRKFQPIPRPKQIGKRRGCRCGNATATPGKLTCCGQRCPCYVESKSCIDCKCRGCRNPHRPDGGKIRPVIPELACYEIQVADESTNLPSSATSNCLEIPLTDLTTSRLGQIKNQSGINFTNHQIRQPVSIENVSREPLLISSQEGNFQVVNVFTSPHQATSLQPQMHATSTHSQLNSHSRSHTHHQIPEISTTLPQIIMQQQEPASVSPHGMVAATPGHSSAIPATISLSPIPTSITLSPIIVTSSNPFPSQIFSDEEIITTHCSPSRIQATSSLVEIASNDTNSNTLAV